MRVSPTGSVNTQQAGYTTLNIDFATATTDQIIAQLTNNPAEQQRYLARIDDELDELFPNGQRDGAKSRPPAETYERERVLALQLYKVITHFREAGDTTFADELDPRYSRAAASPSIALMRFVYRPREETVKALGEDREFNQKKYIEALEFYHDVVRYFISSDTTTEKGLEVTKWVNDNNAYILANDPASDASSQAFHARLNELRVEGEALEETVDIKVHHWRRG